MTQLSWAADVAPNPPVTLPTPKMTAPAPSPPTTLPPAVSLEPVSPTQPPVLEPAAPSPSQVGPPVIGLPPAMTVPPAEIPPAVPAPSDLAAPTTPPTPAAEVPPPVETAVPTVSQPIGPAPATETEKILEEEGMYFNVADEDITEVIKQISRALSKNFILDDKACKGKITIISERKMTKDEVWETFLSALEANKCTIRQGPAGLYRLVPTREAISNPIDFYTSDSPYTDRFITRLITMKNISAIDMSNVIKSLVSKEGNLFAYPVTNTLIITDTGTNIDRLLRLIKELDTEGPQEIMEIIQIVYADAKDIASKITQIFEEEKGGDKARPRRKGAEGEGGDETPLLRKVIPDERTNSVIVLASKRALKDVRDLIKKLDSPLQGAVGEIHVHYLRHAAAKDIASVLTSLSGALSKDKGPPGAPRPPGPGGPEMLSGVALGGKWSVTADETTNSLVITSSAKDYQILVDQVISKLDIPRKQVYVEAVIVELSISEDQQLGFGAIGGKAFNVGGTQVAAFGSTFGFLDPSRLLGGSAGAVNTGDTITINTPGAPGGTGTTQLSVPAFFTALQLAKGTTDVNILSTPNILTLDNQEAEIKVGQKVPFPTAAATTIGGSLQTTFTREDVALTLKIKPQISAADTVRLEVSQEDREVLPQQEQPSIATQAGPSTTERSIKTAIVAQNGQTIVLGGLIKDKYTTVISKVPLLGDIPILGWLFKTRRKSKQKVNLVVFLTPNIIREPRDFLAILQRKIEEKNAFIDENYSKAQRKQIRQSMATHSRHLLEYTPSTEEAPFEEPQKAPTPEKAPTPAPTLEPKKESPKKESGAPSSPDEEVDLAL
ncbi:MAG: type II secretion system secretin GspD [Deltaproteobacteria bacterium]|nr:type II secretion system secretin GspD [Deltaproteobacteria bacterium]